MSSDFNSIKKILIPVDGSPHSIHAVELGISAAKLLNAEVIAVNVIDLLVLDAIAKIADRADVEFELQKGGEKIVNFVLDLAEKKGVRASWQIEKGTPFEKIVNLAKNLEVDLIIMGTLGRRGAERILIGSVAQRVIEYASCPVLVVK